MEEKIKAYDVSLLNKYTIELMKIGKEIGLQNREFWYREQRNADDYTLSCRQFFFLSALERRKETPE